MNSNECPAKDLRSILLLAAVAAAIGIWSIANTVVITKDGVFWIELAQKIHAGTFETSKIEDYPGYPFMLNLWYCLLRFFGLGTSNLSWIFAGQAFGLICRLLSLIPLYFIGKMLVGGRHAFCAILILLFLPWPAEFAHDALREWPHLLFLAGSMLFILMAFTYRRAVFFLPAGIIAAVGHTIRPECAQVIIYAILGLILALIYPNKLLMTRKKAVLGLMLITIGFLTIFLPYVQMRGQILPQKLQELLKTDKTVKTSATAAIEPHAQQAAVLPVPLKGMLDLIKNLSENLYYYFFFFMLIGLYIFLKQTNKPEFDKLLIGSFIIMNFLMYTTLYQHWEYISRRHLLPLTAMTVFFVPLGLETIASIFSKRQKRAAVLVDAEKQIPIFLILMTVGILACVPKLIKNGNNNVGIRKTAEFLMQYTPENAIIAVPDQRIAFYAERSQIVYRTGVPTAKRWNYLVTIEKNSQSLISQDLAKKLTKIYSHPLKSSSDSAAQIAVFEKIKPSK